MKHFIILYSLLAIFIVFHLLSSERNPGKSDEGDTQEKLVSENANNFEHSSSTEKPSLLLEKKFYEFQDELCEGSYKKHENFVNTLDNYIQRYISLFLIASDLVNYEVTDSEETIVVDVELTIKAEDLAFLQNYSKSGKNSPHLRSLSRLDAIFNLMSYVFTNPHVLYCMPLLVILLVVFWIYYFVNRNPYLCILIVISSMMLWDSMILYWKKIKEADLEIYVKLMQTKDIPEDCNPSDMSWYKRVLAPFFQNECLQYYMNLHKTALQEVTLLSAIVDTYAFYLIETPSKILGASVRLFSEEVGALWHGPFKYFVNILLVPLFAVIAIFFILILCGKRLRLSFLWSSLEIGDSDSSTGNKEALTSAPTPKPTRDIRKLKPWTKPRSNTRLRSDFRKKFSLRDLKYFPQAIELVKFQHKLGASRDDIDPGESSSSDSVVKQTDNSSDGKKSRTRRGAECLRFPTVYCIRDLKTLTDN